MYRWLSLGLLLMGEFSRVSASNSILDTTIFINEIEVSAVTGKLQVGSKVQSFDSLQMQTNEGANVGELLGRYAPVYIKSDAGGISSIRIRGTSSTQTSVMFGGFDINSMTLGSSNFSNIPVFLFDQINLQYGSASAENGSGSIGGTLRLGLEDRWTKGVRGEVFTQAGSFGSYTGGFKLAVGNGHWESVSRYYNYRVKNDFPFENTLNYDLNTRSFSHDIQNYSSVKNQGFLQELKYQFSDQEWIKGMVWIEDDWHQAQPTMTENSSSSFHPRTIAEKNQRSWIEYQNNNRNIQWHLAGGYAHDKMTDSNSDTSSIATQRWTILGEIEQHFWGNASYKAGLQYLYILPDVYAYDASIREQHLDVYASVYKQFFKKLTLSLNLRQEWVSHFNAPFTPALGMEYVLNNKDNSSWKWVGNVSRSYRIPTLNDRYWGQTGYAGNTSLQPEEGLNYETGLKYMYVDGITLHTEVRGFYMDVKNWLLWVQGASGFEGKNVQRVVSKGLEFRGDATYSWNDFVLNGGLNGTYNSVVRKASINNTDRLNQQLEYSPIWIGNLWFGLSYKNYGFTTDISYLGERYYDQLSRLKAYSLWNAGIWGKYLIKNHSVKLSANVLNITSTSYQNQYGYAMPAINYRVSLKYYFN